MKQFDIFGKDDKEESSESHYTTKIKTPVYEPKNKKPHLLELIDRSKSNRLINEIKSSNISDEEKKFLIYSAQRHNVFNYSKIADYYANSEKEMQDLMEKSALVIIDFDKAYELGYMKLAFNLANTYLDE